MGTTFAHQRRNRRISAAAKASLQVWAAAAAFLLTCKDLTHGPPVALLFATASSPVEQSKGQ